jgi:hypothetical protein
MIQPPTRYNWMLQIKNLIKIDRECLARGPLAL